MNKKILQKEGLVILEHQPDEKKYLYCMDKNGYIGRFDNRSIKQRRFYVSRLADVSNPYSIYNIKQFLLNNNCEIELLSTVYLANTKKMLWRCKCGRTFYLNWKNFLRHPRKKCSICIRNRYGSNKYSLDFVKEECLKRGLIKLDDNYIDAKTPFKVANIDGYIDEKDFTSIMCGKTHIKFDVRNKYFYQNIRHWFDINNYNCDIIEGNYKSNSDKMKFRCECGATYDCLIGSILYNNSPSIRCPKCAHSISNNELKIKQYLAKKKVKFIQQYKFDGCRNVKPLPFDFYLPEYNIVIEMDGEQHYSKKFLTDEEFNKLKLRDKIKDEYCKNNNIKLVRIPYWEMYNHKYKKIINNILV